MNESFPKPTHHWFMVRRVAARAGRSARPTCAYHNNFRPNCSCLGALAWLLMTPNDVDVTLVLGPENWTRLKAFSASIRNCAAMPGFRSKFLKSETSKFCTPGARSTGEKIGSLPNVNARGWL